MDSASGRLSSEARTIRSSLSLSSISMSSKHILSFSKNKRSNPNLRTQVSQTSLARVEEAPSSPSPQPQETRRLQAPRRLSNRDSYANRNSVLQNGKRSSVQRRTSNRTYAATTSNSKSRGTTKRTTRLWAFGRRELLIDSPGSPNGQSPTNTATSRGLMSRFTKRTEDPRTSEDSSDDPAALPIQRAPSARSVRRPTSNNSRPPVPRRSSRNSSARSSSIYRPQSSIRSSRTRSSGVMTPGYSFPPRPPSSLLGSRQDVILQEYDISDSSSFSSESEEEDPITMRTVRVDRARGGASSQSSHTTTTQDTIMRPAIAPSLSPLADLIEEVAGELEGRPSRDTMYSVMTGDTSLDHYFDAFPAPPSPGKSPGATIITRQLSVSGLLSSINTPAQNTPEGSIDFTSRITAANWDGERQPFKLDMFSQGSVSASASYQSISSALPSPPSTSQGDYMTMGLRRGNNQSLASIRESMEQQMPATSPPPLSPTSSRGTPILRSRSTDPMAQARRRTRVVFGQFVDASQDMLYGEEADAPEIYVNFDRRDTADTLPTPTLTESQSAPSRRGSSKSSNSSLLMRMSGQSFGNALSPSVEGSYSLNSPDNENPNVGIALSNDNRPLGGSSPIPMIPETETGYSSLEDTKPSLFDRRKGRNQAAPAPLSHLRLEPQAPAKSIRAIQTIQHESHESPAGSPSLSPAVGGVASGASSSTNTAASSPVMNSVEAAIITPNVRNQFTVGHAIPGPPAPAPITGPVAKLKSARSAPAPTAPTPPLQTPSTSASPNGNPTSAPTTTPSKRKSFFRTSFFSRRKQNRVSPPPPSPVARAPPMSASAKSTTFFPNNDMAQRIERTERAQTTRPVRSNQSVTSIPTFARSQAQAPAPPLVPAQYAQQAQQAQYSQYPQNHQNLEQSQQWQQWQQQQQQQQQQQGYPGNSGFPTTAPRSSRRPATAPRPSTAPQQQSSNSSFSRPTASSGRQQPQPQLDNSGSGSGSTPAYSQDSLGRRFRQGSSQRELPIQESDDKDRQMFQVAYAT